MTPDDILTLARQGNPTVIAAILNKSTRPHGIQVQIARRDDDLYVLLEGATVTNRPLMVAFIQTSMTKLKVEPIDVVKIYGRHVGDKAALWEQEIRLRPMVTGAPAPSQPADARAILPATLSSHAQTNFMPNVASDGDPASFRAASTSGDGEIAPEAETVIAPDIEPDRPVDAEMAIAPSPLEESDDTKQSGTIQTDVAYEASAQDSTSDLNRPLAEEHSPDRVEAEDTGGNSMNEDAIAPNQDIPIESGSTPISAPASVEEEVGIEQFDSPPGALETVDFQEILKRPEALVLLAFTLVVLAWQFYLALLDDVAPEGSLNTRELADRLQVSRSTISRRKTQPDFSVWSQQLDPDAIAWAYSEGKFIPQLYQPELLDSGS